MEMIPVGPLHGTSSTLGIAGLASEGGSGKFKPSDKHGILHDELALKGAQSLGKRIVEITRLLKS
jgi:hypothetical protein